MDITERFSNFFEMHPKFSYTIMDSPHGAEVFVYLGKNRHNVVDQARGNTVEHAMRISLRNLENITRFRFRMDQMGY